MTNINSCDVLPITTIPYNETLNKQNDIFEFNIINNMIYNDVVNENKNLFKKTSKEDCKLFNNIVKQLFNCLYNIAPKMYDDKNLSNLGHASKQLVSEIIDKNNFQKLRDNTTNNIFNTTLSLKILQKNIYNLVMDYYNQYTKEEKKIMTKMLQKQEEIDKVKQNKDKEMLEKLNKELNLLDKQLNYNKIKDANTSLNVLQDDFKDFVDYSKKEFNAYLNILNNLNIATSADDTHNKIKLSYKEKNKLIDLLVRSHKFYEINENLGRIQEVFKKKTNKKTVTGNIINDIEYGNKLNKILNSEKIKLVEKDTELLFYKDYLNKSLLQYKTAGISKNKGPIILCLDISGSMTGKKEKWAKAVAIATILLALKHKRKCKIICFNNDVKNTIEFNTNKLEIDKLQELINLNMKGGTNFEKPLTKATEFLKDKKYNKADILFISDGYPSEYLSKKLLNKINHLKKHSNLFIQGIGIQCSEEKYLKEFCNTWTEVTDLLDNTKLKGVFNNIER